MEKEYFIFKNGTHFGVHVKMLGSVCSDGRIKDNLCWYYLLSFIKRKIIFFDSGYSKGAIVAKKYEDTSLVGALKRQDLEKKLWSNTTMNIDAYDVFYRPYPELRRYCWGYGSDFNAKQDVIFQIASKYRLGINANDEEEKKAIVNKVIERAIFSRFDDDNNNNFLHAFTYYDTIILDWFNNPRRIVKKRFSDILTQRIVSEDSLFNVNGVKITHEHSIVNHQGQKINLNNRYDKDSENRVCTDFIMNNYYNGYSWHTYISMDKYGREWLRDSTLGRHRNKELNEKVKVTIKEKSFWLLLEAELNERIFQTHSLHIYTKTNDKDYKTVTLDYVRRLNKRKFNLLDEEIIKQIEKQYAKNCLMNRRYANSINITIDENKQIKNITIQYSKDNTGGVQGRINNRMRSGLCPNRAA